MCSAFYLGRYIHVRTHFYYLPLPAFTFLLLAPLPQPLGGGEANSSPTLVFIGSNRSLCLSVSGKRLFAGTNFRCNLLGVLRQNCFFPRGEVDFESAPAIGGWLLLWLLLVLLLPPSSPSTPPTPPYSSTSCGKYSCGNGRSGTRMVELLVLLEEALLRTDLRDDGGAA